MKRAILLLFLPVTLAGCGTISPGNGLLSEENLAQIEVGVTDQIQVREWFGAPNATVADGLGGAHWSYERSELPGWSDRVGHAFDVIVDTIVVSIPPRQPRADADDIHETLVIEFAPTGAVRAYAHERHPGKRPR